MLFWVTRVVRFSVRHSSWVACTISDTHTFEVLFLVALIPLPNRSWRPVKADTNTEEIHERNASSSKGANSHQRDVRRIDDNTGALKSLCGEDQRSDAALKFSKIASKEFKCQQTLPVLAEVEERWTTSERELFLKVLLGLFLLPYKIRSVRRVVYFVPFGACLESWTFLCWIFTTMWVIVRNCNHLVTIPSLDRVVWATEVMREGMCSRFSVLY